MGLLGCPAPLAPQPQKQRVSLFPVRISVVFSQSSLYTDVVALEGTVRRVGRWPKASAGKAQELKDFLVLQHPFTGKESSQRGQVSRQGLHASGESLFPEAPELGTVCAGSVQGQAEETFAQNTCTSTARKALAPSRE